MTEHPWFAKYDKGVPKTIDYPKKPLYHFLEEAASKYPDKACTIFKGAEISYKEMDEITDRVAAALADMGVKKGDRVTIYMGRIPELPVAMLACAKIGAIHSVVYGGFSVEALHGRIEDSQSNVVITCDGGYMNGKIVELKKIVDEAL